MKTIVVGLGVQGCKRKKFAGNDYVASVDPVNLEADYKSLLDVPLNLYDSVLLCVPDQPKVELIIYLLENKKHVLVEKPLWAERNETILALEKLANKIKVVCYTAYNHRFEPHFIQLKKVLDSGELGRLYHCRVFYGNGTAQLVKGSWRDQGSGVLADLGSHLLDTLSFWFGERREEFQLISSNRFENKAPDHVVLGCEGEPRLQLEMTLLSWKNHFTCDVYAEKGSAHIQSLCKWGPSSFTLRKRVLPSGRPEENTTTLIQDDPTWEAEYRHFKNLIEEGKSTDLSGDFWIQKTLRKLNDKI